MSWHKIKLQKGIDFHYCEDFKKFIAFWKNISEADANCKISLVQLA